MSCNGTVEEWSQAAMDEHPVARLLEMLAKRWHGLDDTARLNAMRDLSASLDRATPLLRRRLGDRLRDLGIDDPQTPRLPRPPQARRLEHALALGSRTEMAGLIADPATPLPRSSLTMLVELAASDRMLREALCTRPDLGDDIAGRLWPYLATAQRLRLLEAGCGLLPEEVNALRDLGALDETRDALDAETLARRFDLAGLACALAAGLGAAPFDCLALAANRYVQGTALTVALLDVPAARADDMLQAFMWLRARVIGAADRRRAVADLRLARRLVSDMRPVASGTGESPARREALKLLCALRDRAAARPETSCAA